jgi:hypothetical protein
LIEHAKNTFFVSGENFPQIGFCEVPGYNHAIAPRTKKAVGIICCAQTINRCLVASHFLGKNPFHKTKLKKNAPKGAFVSRI